MEDLSAFSAKPRLRLLRLDHCRQDQGCAAILEGRLSAARGVVPGGVRDDRERRRLRRHRRLGQGASVVPARLRRVPSRHSLRRLAALRHEPHQPRPVHGLLFVMGRAMDWPDKLDLVAIDGKTSRRSHNRKTGHKALHLVSALRHQHAAGPRPGGGRSRKMPNEIDRHPGAGGAPRLDGALVSIDAMGCRPHRRRVDPRRQGGLPSGRQRQPADPACRHRKLFRNRAAQRGQKVERSTRTTAASRFATIASPRSSIGMLRSAPMTGRTALPASSPPSPWSRAGSSAGVHDRNRAAILYLRLPGRSRPQPTPRPHAATGRSKTSCTGSSMSPSGKIYHRIARRPRTPATNMAVVRHFALNLVRQVADKRSIKRRRKRASWDPQYLLEILGRLRC